MKQHNRFRNLFFEAMQRYNIQRYKSFTGEATSSPVLYDFSPFFPILCFPPPPFCSRSPSILENVSITAILHILLCYRQKKKNVCESNNCGQKYSSTENLLIFLKYLGIICITFKGTVHKHANV